jgi:hypothetical protein
MHVVGHTTATTRAQPCSGWLAVQHNDDATAQQRQRALVKLVQGNKAQGTRHGLEERQSGVAAPARIPRPVTLRSAEDDRISGEWGLPDLVKGGLLAVSAPKPRRAHREPEPEPPQGPVALRC